MPRLNVETEDFGIVLASMLGLTIAALVSNPRWATQFDLARMLTVTVAVAGMLAPASVGAHSRPRRKRSVDKT